MEAQELQAVSLSEKQNDRLEQWNRKSLCSIWVLLKKEVWHACDGMWAQIVQCAERLFTCPPELWTSLLAHHSGLPLSFLGCFSKLAAR